MKSVYAVLAMAFAMVAAPAMATTITYNDGSYFVVPGNKRVVIIDRTAPLTAWTLGDKIKLKDPKPGRKSSSAKCARPGELVVGPTKPCAVDSDNGGLSLGS